jgi:hypothetical protein
MEYVNDISELLGGGICFGVKILLTFFAAN